MDTIATASAGTLTAGKDRIVLDPLVASMPALAGVNRRATVAAFYLFMVNLISMGLGPLVIGVLSDFFHGRYGELALRYSLMSLTAITCAWAALHLFLAGRTIASDLQHTSA
jgi:MFS family permease